MISLVRYLDREVAITLTNGYFYKGKVIDCDNLSLTLLDVTGKSISLILDAILTIREVESNGSK